MDSLSFYLRTTVTEALHDLHLAILAYFDRFDTDMYIPMIDSVLATADDRDTAEVLAFIQSIITDQTNAILMAHRIQAYPETLQHAYDYLRALDGLQDAGGDMQLVGLLEEYDNPEDAFGEVVAYLCGTQAEDYLNEISQVDPVALETIRDAIEETDATEDEDYDDDDSDQIRRQAVPWVRERVLRYRAQTNKPSVVLTHISEGNLKLALPVEVLWAAVIDDVLDLPEPQWPHELICVALASRLPQDEIADWVAHVLERNANDPAVVMGAQRILHQLITPEV